MIYTKNKFHFFDELSKYIMQYLVTAWYNKQTCIFSYKFEVMASNLS